MTKIEILENGNVKLTIPMSFRHCAGRKRIIVPDDSEKLVDPLVLNLARAFRWQELIDSGTYSNAIELARAVGKDTAYVARTVRLTLLAPEIPFLSIKLRLPLYIRATETRSWQR